MTYLGNQPADVAVVIADGAVDTAQLAADAVENAKIADNSIDSEHYVDNSIDEAHINDDAVSKDQLKTLVTLLIINSAGTTVKTLYGAGA